MTIQNVVSALQAEKKNKLPSRFPCRAIMVKTIKQYCILLSELKKISDIRVIKSQEIFSSADVMPDYSKLCSESYRDEWVILTGVSEYLRLFAKNESVEQRFASLWKYQAAANNMGRIIIPLWGCEAQWFDRAIDLNGDVRQEDFYYDCTTGDDPEQEMQLTVLSRMFDPYAAKLKNNNSKLFYSLLEWSEYWEEPSSTYTKFILITKRYNKISEVRGEITICVLKDVLSYVQANMRNGEHLTKDNCSEEMLSQLFPYALAGKTLENALLNILNVLVFDGKDIMGKWGSLSVNEKRFVALWFQINPDDSYISHCFTIAEQIPDIENVISHEIFKMRGEKPYWVEEFKSLSKIMPLKRDEAYFTALDEIPEFEKRLDYLTNSTREERIYILKMVGQWMRVDAEQVVSNKKLKKVFPDLAVYLSQTLDALKNDVGEYMLRYKAYKLENALPIDEEAYFCGVNVEQFDYRYSVLSQYEDDETIILWIDALGVEWISLLCHGIKQNCEGKLTNAVLTQATLPTETCFNEQWKNMNMPYEKLDKLDKLAHKGVVDEPDYYTCIEEQIGFVVKIGEHVSSLLKKYNRVVITGDHGTSRLAARFFHMREGYNAPAGAVVCSHGRYCKLSDSQVSSTPNTKIAKNVNGETYEVYCNYDHFKQSGFAAGADDENAIYGEVHGGATPEEMIVPVVVVERNKNTQITASWVENSVKISMRKAKLSIRFNSAVKNISVKMGAVYGAVEKVDAGKKWNIVFSKVKPGIYPVEVIADGHIVSLPNITLRSALGNGGGDLP